MQQRVRFPEAFCYMVNLALVATHQVDAAFQHEWQLLHVPGGIRFFMLFNFVALLTLLWGLAQVASGASSGRLFTRIMATVGGITVAIHATLLSQGDPNFRDVSSLVNLTLILGFSIAQLASIRGEGSPAVTAR